MKAELVKRDHAPLGEGAFAETVIWRVPQPVRGSTHSFKYRLAFVVDRVCVLRYDNEAGKGDHKHIGNVEVPYQFTSLDDLVDDFWRDIENWSKP